MPLSKSLALIFVALWVCFATHPAIAQGDSKKPKLLVLFVVDGLPQRQIVAYRDQFASDGFRRFLNRGASFSNAFYAHATTLTAPGHATMLTGSYAYRSGIIANEWANQKTGDFEYCTGDIDYHYIDNKTSPRDGTSPKNLKAETLGDVLRKQNPKSKVISISGKDRGAILPAGKLGTAYMYQAQSGQFASTTYYMNQHPQWVDVFNSEKRADGYFKKEWKPLLNDDAYAISLPDNQAWYPKGGYLPKVIEGAVASSAPDPAFYGELLRSPFGDALTLDFARAAIRGEGLGKIMPQIF